MQEEREALQKEIEALREENLRLREIVLGAEGTITSLQDAEKWLQTAMRDGNMWLWRWDAIEDYTVWSHTAYEILSSPSLPFDGTITSYYERIHPDDREYIYQTHANAVATGEDSSLYYRVLLPNEPMRWMDCRARPYRNAQGIVQGLMGVTREVTTQRYIDEAIDHITASGETGFDSGFFEKVARQLAEILGADIALIGKIEDPQTEVVTTLAYYQDGELRPTLRYALEGTPCQYVYGKTLCLFANGVAERFPEDVFLQEERVVGYVGIPLFDNEGTPLGLMNALWRRPISNPEMITTILRLFASRVVKELEREKLSEQIVATESDLQRQTRLLKETQKIAEIGGWEFDPQTQAVYWTDQMFLVYDVDPATFSPSYDSVLACHTPESRTRILTEIEQSAKTGEAFEVETTITISDGSLRWLKTVGQAQQDKSGYMRVYGACRDITREKHETLERETSRANLIALIENRPDLILSLDREYKILIMNTPLREGFRINFGTTPVVGRPLHEFLPPSLWELWKARYDRAFLGETFHIDEVIEIPTGNFHAQVHFSPIVQEGKITGVTVFSRDVTQQVKMQEELQQSLKMEGLGRLAGGVAHDFNNILTAIIGYIELIQENLPSDSRLQYYAQQVMQASEKAAGLTSQLLAFARKQLIQPQPVALNKTIEQTMLLLKRLIGEDIELQLDLNATEDVVLIDPGQAEQILVNLAVNARDAMPTGGRLTIQTQNRQGAEFLQPDSPLSSMKNYFVLVIEDTGFGMNEEVKNRIFEPFYTTKPLGQGTGLGLSMCYGVVQQADGTIQVESQEGQGTTFSIYFPCSDEKTVTTPLILPARLKRGGETILLVEDEPLVREMAAEILQAQGYRLLVATSATEALKIATDENSQIDMLLTDVVMPQMSGKQVADFVTQHHPKAKVLYMSGYTEDAIVRHQVLQEGVTLLPKPFTSTFLTQKVREILERS